MRAQHLLTLGLAAPITITAHSIHCYDHPTDSNAEIGPVQKIEDALSRSIGFLCHREPLIDQDKIVKQQVGNLTIQITLEEGHTPERCKSAFADIISQCLVTEKVHGGELEVDGFLYEMFDGTSDESNRNAALHQIQISGRDDYRPEGSEDWGYSSDHPILSREPQNGDGGEDWSEFHDNPSGLQARKSKSKPKPKPKPVAPKPKPQPKPEPAQPKPKPAQKPGTKPKPSPKKPSPKPTPSPKAQPTQSCQEILKIARANARKDKNAKKRDEIEGYIFAEDVVGRANQTLKEEDGTSVIDKRATKPGQTCGKVRFDALDYPDNSAAQLDGGAKYYGFKFPDQCKRMEWGSGPLLQKPTGRKPGGLPALYEVEHILEWNVVTSFFDWVSTTNFNGAKRFPGATAGAAKVTFCDYWTRLWDTNFQIGSNTRTAKQHIQHAYPSRQFYPEEFPLLDEDINAPPKYEMWRTKRTPGIWSIARLKRETARQHDAQGVVMQLKWAMGARKYLKDPTIKKYFALEKNRIGTVLDEIDSRMPGWTHMGLKGLWDKYMDEKFATAKSRLTYTMDTHLADLERRYVPGSAAQKKLRSNTLPYDIMTTVKALSSEWRREKRSVWEAPWASRGTTLEGEHAK